MTARAAPNRGPVLTFAAELKGEYLDRAAKKWVALKVNFKSVTFKVEDHGVELIRVTR